MTQRCSLTAAALYKLFVTGDCVIASGPRAAEMAKLTENSFRDVNIAFANELSLICDELGIDVWELIMLANRHPRVNILQPGPGVGGHCIAVDPWFIVSSAPHASPLIQAARKVNSGKPEWVMGRIKAALGNHLADHPASTASEVRIAVYGLAFKPDIDDLRESPALEIAQDILGWHKGPMLVVEPNVDVLPASLHGAELVQPAEAAKADIHVMLVDHKSFKGSAKPKGEIVDTRGIWAEAPSLYSFVERRMVA
jgi:UDP-N-acetyl-D-mannosaminuronic acid dehydrogenase